MYSDYTVTEDEQHFITVFTTNVKGMSTFGFFLSIFGTITATPDGDASKLGLYYLSSLSEK